MWLRQTGIFHPEMLGIRDAIMLHVPLAGVMEWVSVGDSARLIGNACEDGVPDEFWGGVYNIGGGEGWRLTNWELQSRVAVALGVKDVRRWYDRNWFATQNFHGIWYTDSDVLESYLHFRSGTFDDALANAVSLQPLSTRLAGKIPGWLVKRFVIAPLTRQSRGTMSWIRDYDEARVRAYFGSRQEWEAIGDWSSFTPPQPSRTPTILDHGYDESIEPSRWSIAMLQDAARFRGGRVLAEKVAPVRLEAKLRWACTDGHVFEASARLVLTAGHWCPVCVARSEDYERQAESNAFLAQVI